MSHRESVLYSCLIIDQKGRNGILPKCKLIALTGKYVCKECRWEMRYNSIAKGYYCRCGKRMAWIAYATYRCSHCKLTKHYKPAESRLKWANSMKEKSYKKSRGMAYEVNGIPMQEWDNYAKSL